MRHVVSLVALVSFVGLAIGSSSPEPSPVQGRVDGPEQVVADKAFPFTVHLRNDSDAAVSVETVVVPGDAVRSLGVVLPGATSSQAFGDGMRYTIPAVSVPPGQEVRIADFQGTPYLSGYQSETLELCASDGICHDVTVNTRVQGGAAEVIEATWTAPDTVTAGEPFEITVDLRNASGGDDIVETLGLDRSAAEWLEISASEPAHKGPGEALMRQVWRYDLGLGPGDQLTVRWTATASSPGEHELEWAVCTSSEAFCQDTAHTLTVTAADTDG